MRSIRQLATRMMKTDALKKFDISEVAVLPYFVPETTTLDDQMRQFLRNRSHFALVVDEYGSLQGIDHFGRYFGRNRW